MKPEVAAGSHEESVVLNGSLTQVLADLIASQGLRAGEQLRDAGSGLFSDRNST